MCIRDSGCSPDCKIELDAVCGFAAALAVGDTPGDFAGGTAALDGSCDDAGPGLERVYRFTTTDAGTLSVSVASESPLTLYVLAACENPPTELACASFVPGQAGEPLTQLMNTGTSVLVVVDAPAGYAGSYVLTTAFTPSG